MVEDGKGLATRDDLVCESCGEEFIGTVRQKVCPECEEPEENVEEMRTAGTDIPVEETPIPDRTADDRYRKRIHVDKGRERAVIGRRQRGKGRDSTPRESKEEKKRKRPLRERLAKLDQERADLVEKVDEIDRKRSEVLLELEPKDGELVRDCFGNYDRSDYDCTSICPLSVECRMKTIDD